MASDTLPDPGVALLRRIVGDMSIRQTAVLMIDDGRLKDALSLLKWAVANDHMDPDPCTILLMDRLSAAEVPTYADLRIEAHELLKVPDSYAGIIDAISDTTTTEGRP